MTNPVAERGGNRPSSCFPCRVFKPSIFIRLYFYLNFQETLNNKLWEKHSPSCGVSHSTEGGSGACWAAGQHHSSSGVGRRVVRRERGRYSLHLYMKKNLWKVKRLNGKNNKESAAGTHWRQLDKSQIYANCSSQWKKFLGLKLFLQLVNLPCFHWEGKLW